MELPTVHRLRVGTAVRSPLLRHDYCLGWNRISSRSRKFAPFAKIRVKKFRVLRLERADSGFRVPGSELNRPPPTDSHQLHALHCPLPTAYRHTFPVRHIFPAARHIFPHRIFTTDSFVQRFSKECHFPEKPDAWYRASYAMSIYAFVINSLNLISHGKKMYSTA